MLTGVDIVYLSPPRNTVTLLGKYGTIRAATAARSGNKLLLPYWHYGTRTKKQARCGRFGLVNKKYKEYQIWKRQCRSE